MPQDHLESNLSITTENGVCTLRLDRPSRKNALDRSLVLALASALRELPERPDVQVVILTGSAGSFCSGADLTTVAGIDPGEIGARIDEFHQLIRGIVEAPQPVIAAWEGPAVGFGADLALCCDLRVLSTTAFLEEGFVKIGLMPDGGGTYWLEKFLGPSAFEALVLGTRLDANACQKAAIANQVVPAGRAEEEARRLAERLAQAAPLSVQAIKRTARARDRGHLDQTLALEKSGQEQLFQSEDFAEGVAAFLEKRAPVFRGK